MMNISTFFMSCKLLILINLFSVGNSNINVLDSILDESYDGRNRPHSQGYPTEIQVTAKIDAVENLDLVNHEVSLTMEIVEVWNDPRLDSRSLEEIRQPVGNVAASNNITKDKSDKVAIDDTGRLWMPSLYLRNIKGSPTDARVVKVDGHSGQVTKLTKVNMVVACDLEFFYFPWDKQSCEFKISTLEYSKDEVMFLWKDDTKPFSVSTSLSHAHLYVLKGFSVSNGTSEGILGEHSELGIKLLFVRQKMRNFPFYYFPPMALCVTAFFSLWMTVSHLPIYISLISFVTGILHYVLMDDQLPTLTDMGMYDHYVFLCINLILNCVIVNILMYGFHNPSHKMRKTSIVGRSVGGKVEMKTFNGIPPDSPQSGTNHKNEASESQNPEDIIYRMSRFKRFIYFKVCKPAKWQLPVTFLIINVIYWCWILIASLPFPSGFQRI